MMILSYGQYRALLEGSTLQQVADDLNKKGIPITYDTSGFPPKELRNLQEMLRVRKVRTKDVRF